MGRERVEDHRARRARACEVSAAAPVPAGGQQSRNPDDLGGVLEHLIEWLEDPSLVEVKRSFAEWLLKVLLPNRLPGVRIPEVEDPGEVKAMLAERVKEWTRPWVEQGMEQGIQKGVREGEASILKRLLEIRFRPLPEVVVQRIEAAASDERLVWSERLLHAATLDEVFAAD